MAKETILANEIDTAKLEESARMLEKNSDIIESIAINIVKSYAKPLDDIMDLCNTIFNSNQPATDGELEDLALRLPSCLYFTGVGQESIGIKEDIAKAVRTELFNKSRQDAKGTIADKDSIAEMASMHEAINHVIYQRAYKIMKMKMEAGYEQLNSIKKIISRRELDVRLGFTDPTGLR